MNETPEMQDIVQSVTQKTIAAYPEIVRAWQVGTPKTWGYLAGRAVGAARRRVGRPLTDEERRRVWAALWRQLQVIGQTADDQLPPN